MIYITIARNYLTITGKRQSISTMLKICLISIFIGVTSLALSIFIMTGFEEETKNKLQNINPQVILQPLGTYLNFNKIKPILESEFPEIAAFSPSSSQYAILQTGKEIDLSKLFFINAIDPKSELRVTNIATFITAKFDENANFAELLKNRRILIGKKLAQAEGLFPGDKTKLVFAKQNKKNIDFETVDVEISGLFGTGIDELDSKSITCSLDFFKTHIPEVGITQIGIKLKNKIDEQVIINKLKNRFGLDVYSWQDLYPSLVSVLKLEKYVVFVVLLLLIIIASMNLISLIFMLITQKKRDIAILYSMGMRQSHIKSIFIIISLTITIIASIAGLTFATCIGLYLQNNPIELPDVYYVSYLPIRIDLIAIYIIFASAIFISLIASWIAIRNIKNMNLSEILRFE